MHRATTIFQLLLTVFLTTSGQAQAKSFVEFKEAFDAKQYENALNLLSRPPERSNSILLGNYHFNKGTVLLHLGREGEAFGHLTFARHLLGSAADISNNVEIARQRFLESRGNPNLDRVSSPLQKLGDIFSDWIWLSVLTLGGIAFVAFGGKTKGLGTLKIAVFSLVIICGAISAYAQLYPKGILIEAVQLRSGPGAQFSELSKLEAGFFVRVLRRRTADSEGRLWIQVEYGVDQIGWIPLEQLLSLGKF